LRFAEQIPASNHQSAQYRASVFLKIAQCAARASCFKKERAMPKQATLLRNLTIAALAAASLSLPIGANAQSTDQNILAIERGTTVPVQSDASQSDPNINAILDENKPLYNWAGKPGRTQSVGTVDRSKHRGD
jgi:hypothetical protein